jgi:hypothetical protein
MKFHVCIHEFVKLIIIINKLKLKITPLLRPIYSWIQKGKSHVLNEKVNEEGIKRSCN